MQIRTFVTSAAVAAMILAMGSGCAGQNGAESEAQLGESQPIVAEPEIPAESLAATADPPAEAGEEDAPSIRITGVVLDVGLAELCGVEAARAHFEYDSAQLDPQAQATVRQIAECLDGGPLAGQNIAIIGHADPRGPDDYNRELGMSRAESVADVLVRNGLAKDRLEVESAGEALAHETPELWPLDRRVDIRIAGS